MEKINIKENNNNLLINDFVINKKGNIGYILLNNGKIYINNNLENFFNKKSNFNLINIKIKNVF